MATMQCVTLLPYMVMMPMQDKLKRRWLTEVYVGKLHKTSREIAAADCLTTMILQIVTTEHLS